MVKMQGSLPHGCIQEKEVLCLGTLATDLGAKLLERNSYNKTSSHARARQICKPILFECVPRSGKDHNFVIIGVPKESYPEIVVLSGSWDTLDRKSTRLKSSHVRISYAVFCL